MDQQINLIRPCHWEEVFLTWYKNEGENPDWINLAKERGFASWADWRLNDYARRFECEKVEWGFYEINDPSEVVSDWFGGPFRTWIEKYYNGEKTKSFKELVDKPDLFSQPKIDDLTEGYPKDSIISALKLKNGKIYVIEGTHRSCALALMKKQGKNYPGKMIFAIGESKLDELPIVGQNTL
jgi:hypothetical protein